MAIYSPEVYLTSDDRELLHLLASLLVEGQTTGLLSNQPDGSTQLSDSESRRLLSLLEMFVESRKFIEGQHFVEALVGAKPDEKVAREIYLSWRRRYGKTRAVATVQWQNFLSRLGLHHPELGGPALWYRPSALPMDFEYFVKMERKLANAANLSPRVRELIISFVAARSEAVEALRTQQSSLTNGAVAAMPKNLLADLQQGRGSQFGHEPISTTRLAAILTIVLDCSTLFTTRDWSVAGFLSTIAGAVPPAISK